MGIKKLQPKSLPDFNIPEEYKANIWNIKEMDCYKTACKDTQKKWDARSSISNGNLNFLLCENEYIREEFKYVFFKFVERGIKIGTIAEYYDRFKQICMFIKDNNNHYSILEYDLADFEKYFIFRIKNKPITQNGTKVNKDMENKQQTRRNRTITFFQLCQTTIQDYLDKDLPLMERDVWNKEQLLKYVSDVPTGRKLDFTAISQLQMRQDAKAYCRSLFHSVTINHIYSKLRFIKLFCEWLYEYDSDIKKFNQLDRDVIEDYFSYLRVELDCSDVFSNKAILYLKNFFEAIMLLEYEDAPTTTLITERDYTFKSTKEARYFTDEEMKNITAVIKKLNKTDGKIIFCLMTLGVRINELLSLTPSCLLQNDDGSYYLVINQSKVKREYKKELSSRIADILKNEIERNTKRLKSKPDYIFIDSKGNKINSHTLSNRINKVFYLENVLDRNGNTLRFRSHRFRATVATSLINSGYGAKETAKILGHSSLESLNHYIKLHDENTLKQLAPRLERDNILISNIFTMEKLSIEEPKQHATPLCNGWCVRDLSLGLCQKANACLTCGLFQPSIEFLNNYYMQLQEVEAAIEIYKADNMEALLNKNLQLKETLEKIIAQVKEKLDEKSNGNG